MATERELDRREWRRANPELVRAQKKAYYARHRERILAEQKSKRDANKEGFYEQRRQGYAAKREELRAVARARYAADPERAERIRALNRKYRASRLDEFRERDKRYAQAHKERDRARFTAKIRRANLTRRALTVSAFVEAVDSLVVFHRDRGVCGICRRPVNPKSLWHIDHVVPLSKGGVHSYDNVQLAHARCNLSKQDKVPIGQIRLFQKLPGGAK